jgi:hypothetical protein
MANLADAAATVRASLTEIHGIKARTERPEALGAANLIKLDLSGTVLICLFSSIDKTPAHIRYAARHSGTELHTQRSCWEFGQ